MSVTMLAGIELLLLVAGALLARRLAAAMAKGGDSTVVLMSCVGSWFVLFGMVPFLVFALFVKRAASANEVGLFATAVLNVIPFAMITSPLIGFAHGMFLRKQQPEP